MVYDDNKPFIEIEKLSAELSKPTVKIPELLLNTRESLLTVSTIHKAKGREFDCVYLLNSGFTPNATDTEEARVWYVGCTRAKNQLNKLSKKNQYLRKSGSNPSRWAGLGFHKARWGNNHCSNLVVGLPKDILAAGFVSGDLERAIETQEPIEITTYRIDGDYSDNLRPDSVSFTRNLKEDLARRDFTINALAMDADGIIVDYFGGAEDIKIGIIRCVGNAMNRFTEDALRILRALRFAAVLGFSIDTETKKAIFSEAQRLHNISAERINVELTKLLCGRNAVNNLRECAEVVAVVIPETKPLFGFDQQNPHHIYDVWEHTLQVVANTPAEPVLRWAALLHDIGKPQAFSVGEDGVGHFYGHAESSIKIADEIMVRLKFDNASRNRIKTLIERHDLAIRPTKATVKRWLNRLGTETLSQLFKLQRADNLAHAPKDVYKQKIIDNLERIMSEIIAENECFSLSDLAVNGNDMLALGYSGKAVGDMLDELLNAIIDGELPNERKILLDKAEKRFPND